MRWASLRPRTAASSDVTGPRSSGAADLDQAVVQFVHGFRVLVGILVVEVLVDDAVDGLAAAGGWVGLMSGQRSRYLQCRGRCEHPADGEVDGCVDDGAAGSQLRGLVVDGEHRVLAVLRQHRGQGAKPGGTGQLAELVRQRDPLVTVEHQQHGALGADLLGVAADRPSKVCSA
jgi:hypothetical protein